MASLSSEQMDVVNMPLGPIAVTACAGSGKTRTAVHRLALMRRMEEGRGLVALLSFSNVAVDTFRRDYADLLRSMPVIGRSASVEIDTMDGFITTNVLRPHGHLVMGCSRAPYLVEGSEAFLKAFTVFDGKIPRPTADIDVAWDGVRFSFLAGRAAIQLPSARAEAGLARLGSFGAYSHSAGRYWVLRILREKPFVLRALSRRYPHILVDEAQDVGPEHQAILDLLIDAGSQVSLIGDPNQGIYDFARADGGFLRSYGARSSVSARTLSVNYRSLPGIVDVANRLTGGSDTADRKSPNQRSVAYYIPYRMDGRDDALASFRSLMGAAGLNAQNGVVLCRSSDLTAEWRGEMDGQGVGVVRCMAEAAISRDRRDFNRAFQKACVGLSGLLAAKHGSVGSELARPIDERTRLLRRLVWSFVRDPVAGLPSAALVADTVWHPQMNTRVRAIVATMVADFGFEAADNLGQRLANKKLTSQPLVAAPTLATDQAAPLRTSTVHRVKGESIESVLYVAKKPHVRALLAGTGTEDGRIGYVALTRAKDLFVLAVPENCLKEFEPALQAAGLVQA
ncbi:UvrD-helicase domain-containing protein [Tsuneonella sp. HG094]